IVSAQDLVAERSDSRCKVRQDPFKHPTTQIVPPGLTAVVENLAHRTTCILQGVGQNGQITKPTLLVDCQGQFPDRAIVAGNPDRVQCSDAGRGRRAGSYPPPAARTVFDNGRHEMAAGPNPPLPPLTQGAPAPATLAAPVAGVRVPFDLI